MQKLYETFTATDFVCDDSFLQHFVAPTAGSNLFWEEWLQQHPHRQTEWQQARQLTEAVQAGLSDYARTYLSEEAEARLLAQIQATNNQVQPVAVVRPLWQSDWVYRAAAACFLLAIGYWIFSSQLTKPSVYQQQIAALPTPPVETANATQTTKFVRLPDGSTVVLSPRSQLRYPTDYGQQNRTVYLQGEATFDVAKDAQKPFFVYAGEVVTKVLGTKFVVRSFERDPKVIVTVQRGQVSVFKGLLATEQTNPDKTVQGVLLQPNQQAIFSRETKTFAKTLVISPQRIDNQKVAPINFVFNETPVTAVFDKLEEAYGIDIVYNANVLSGCQLTASLNDESLFQKLDIIAQSIDATYEVVEGQVVITSRGCSTN